MMNKQFLWHRANENISKNFFLMLFAHFPVLNLDRLKYGKFGKLKNE